MLELIATYLTLDDFPSLLWVSSAFRYIALIKLELDGMCDHMDNKNDGGCWACPIIDCRNRKKGRFCAYHQCRKLMCSKQQQEHSSMCVYHTCNVKNCYNENTIERYCYNIPSRCMYHQCYDCNYDNNPEILCEKHSYLEYDYSDDDM